MKSKNVSKGTDFSGSKKWRKGNSAMTFWAVQHPFPLWWSPSSLSHNSTYPIPIPLLTLQPNHTVLTDNFFLKVPDLCHLDFKLRLATKITSVNAKLLTLVTYQPYFFRLDRDPATFSLASFFTHCYFSTGATVKKEIMFLDYGYWENVVGSSM